MAKSAKIYTKYINVIPRANLAADSPSIKKTPMHKPTIAMILKNQNLDRVYRSPFIVLQYCTEQSINISTATRVLDNTDNTEQKKVLHSSHFCREPTASCTGNTERPLTMV